MRLPIVLALAAFATAAAAGEVYKWKDKDGRVHYGDKPKHEAQAVDVPGDEPDADVRAADYARDAECRKQKAQLEKYRKAGKIQEQDNLGNVRDYTDAERDKFLQLTEQKVAAACAAQPSQAAAPPAQ